MLVTRLVVVVFPWVPAIAIPWRNLNSSASMMARGTTGTFLSRAAITSGLSGQIAVEVTTASAGSTFTRAWPVWTTAPNFFSRRVIAVLFKSEPLT
jgi:hypothetical protein